MTDQPTQFTPLLDEQGRMLFTIEKPDGPHICAYIQIAPVITPTKPKPRRWVFESTGETRCPKAGELFANMKGLAERATVDFVNNAHEILKLVERPE